MPRELIYKDEALRAILQTNSMFAYCINNIKPVDAVEVVRCKDCAFFSRNTRVDRDRGDCLKYGYGCIRIKKLDDFCSYGERKDNE